MIVLKEDDLFGLTTPAIKLRDWEVLEWMNGNRSREKASGELSGQKELMTELSEKASGRVAAEIDGFNFPFRVPKHKSIALTWATGK